MSAYTALTAVAKVSVYTETAGPCQIPVFHSTAPNSSKESSTGKVKSHAVTRITFCGSLRWSPSISAVVISSVYTVVSVYPSKINAVAIQERRAESPVYTETIFSGRWVA